MTGSVFVAISGYRSDDAVIGLIEQIFADPHPEVASILVVDSLGSGNLPAQIASRGWSVYYDNSDRNLGSAGNLARRIALAADSEGQWCLCLNHDANWSSKRLSAMLEVARSHDRVGAVYPILHHGKRENPWEDGRRSFAPSAGKQHRQIPTGNSEIEVHWSSSNGALYSTAPLEEGITVMEELWMGYEDLAYGIALFHGGWLQLVCREAVLRNIFDLTSRRFLGREMHIPSKPVWYSYYNIRNLLLIRKHCGSHGVTYPMIMLKLLQSTLRTMLLEDKKGARLLDLYRGTLAGLRGRSGKGLRP